MDSRYVPIYKQAAVLQHQFHDLSNGAAHNPQAMVLRNEIHHLTNDLATNKNPRTIDHRLQTIQHQLRLAQTLHPGMMGNTGGFNHQPLLNNHQSMTMHKNFEMMRKNIRMNPHF
jgi:hypothetical protein